MNAVDLAGNQAASAPFAFMTPPAVPPLAITEVLANPAGPEPQQEYVELRNLGDADVSLAGLRLADSKGGDDLPPETLAAGGYALVVTASYDPARGPDPPPRPGTLLVRVDTRLGSDGLSNGGEAVQLLQGEAVVSSYGGWVAVSAGSWNGKAVHRLVQSACDAPGGLEPHPAAAHARQRPAVTGRELSRRENSAVRAGAMAMIGAMSGHNRWTKIKHKKEASDSKKSKVWTKLIKELTLSARLGRR